MAFVGNAQPDGTTFWCSGTVVAPNVVLTAGHCGEDAATGIVESPAHYGAFTGSLDWTNSAARQVSAVSRVIVDPAYNRVTHQNDAALLVLATPTTAPAIPLASDPQDLGLLNPGTPAQIAGWGATATEPASTSLLWGGTVVQRPTYCANEASLMSSSFNQYNQLCVIDYPSFADSACHGDSGGPLLARNTLGQWVEIGVTSWSASNCNTADPQYFTRADVVYTWVHSELATLTPTPATAPTTPPAIATTPASASSSGAPAQPKHPLPGVYRGRTSQHQPLQLRISRSNSKITSLNLAWRLRCSRPNPTIQTYNALVHGQAWKLNMAHGFSFSRVFRDGWGERYQMSGTFTPGGSVTGTLRTVWNSHRFGFCSSGKIRWSARSSQLTSATA